MKDQNTHETNIFQICTFNELLARKEGAGARQLFGDLWLEGELSVMFAEAGCGKSVLAVQIADSISRGRAHEPFDTRPRRQKVLFIDIESLPGHFCSRYKYEDEKSGKRPHRFSSRLIHADLTGTREVGVADIERLVEETGARVLVIDNLEHLMKRHSTAEADRVMRELRRMTRVRGLSVLLLAHSAAASLRRGIESCDVPFARVMAGHADNVFAIGRVASHADGRYIKHIRPGSTPHVFGAAHVPWFRIVKRANLTYFKFGGFGRESVLRSSDDDRHEWQLIDLIRELHDAKLTVREIASSLRMSKSTVGRYLMMSRDDEREADSSTHESEEELFEPLVDDDEDYWPLTEMDGTDVHEFEFESEEDPDLTYQDPAPALEPDFHVPEPALEEEPSGHSQLSTTNSHLSAGLSRDVDSNGREIFVEKRDERGKPLVWYIALTSNGVPTGKFTRNEHRGLGGIIGKTVDGLPGIGYG